MAVERLLLRQAEISFAAGIKEVTQWIEEHSRMTYERARGEIAIDCTNYQTKLKEWGIK